MKIRLTLLFFTALFTLLFSCENKKPPAENEAPAFDQAAYLTKGQAVASATFAALSGQLQAALKAGGVPNAVEYCNMAAYPLVDSLSKVHQANIRRTSLKVRNPKDAPSPAEKVILEQYEKTAQAGGELKPIVQEVDGQAVAFYAPIKVNALCLQCHGKIGETLQETDYAAIKKHYPNDEATGYADGDLRGMWSIRFKKQ